MMNKVPGAAKIMFPMIDVRDAAIAHIKALETDAAKDLRFLIVGDNIWFKDLALVLSDHFTSWGYNIKTGELKYWMLKVASWIDEFAKCILPMWDREQRMNNEKSLKVLGMYEHYRPYSETIVEMGQSFIERGLIPDKRKKK